MARYSCLVCYCEDVNILSTDGKVEGDTFKAIVRVRCLNCGGVIEFGDVYSFSYQLSFGNQTTIRDFNSVVFDESEDQDG